jgi:tRNA-dihydrouridine synthase
MCKYKGEIVGIKESRKHLAAYLKGFQRAAELRKMVFSAQSKEELFEICDSIK